MGIINFIIYTALQKFFHDFLKKDKKYNNVQVEEKGLTRRMTGKSPGYIANGGIEGGEKWSRIIRKKII